jgi:hypothetical protein
MVALLPKEIGDVMGMRFTSLCRAAALAGAGCVVLAAQPASAEQAGAYSGHTADGNAITFDVGVNAQGQPALMDMSIRFTAACSQSGSSITQSWKFFFYNGLPIANGRVKHLENNPQLYLLNNVKFGSHSASGTTEARLPVLIAGKSGTSVQLCASAPQAFKAEFHPADGSNPFERAGDAHFRTPTRTAILEWSEQGVVHQEMRKEQ